MSEEKALEVVTSAVDRVFEGEDRGAVECIKTALETLKTRVQCLTSAAQETEFDLEPKKDLKVFFCNDKAMAKI
jgi:hypothetical protein